MFRSIIRKLRYLYGLPCEDPDHTRLTPAYLLPIRGPFVGKELVLQEGHNTVGRGAGSDLVIRDEEDPTVSRLHATIQVAGLKANVHDNQSTNGTFVNGERVASCDLFADDEIRIGDSVFILQWGQPSQRIAALPVSRDLLGQELSHTTAFETQEVVGTGGMATVYRAVTKPEGKTVAVKIPHPEFCHDSEFEGRFFQEAEVGSRLDHPNIVAVYGYGRLDSLPYLLMEYVDGESIRARLERTKLDSDEVKYVGGCLCKALDYAHRQRIIHRDIKPENLKFTLGGIPKLMDFGIAKDLDQKSGRQTIAGAILGTPYYIAPERISGAAENVDGRADLYSLGILLYELVTRQVPFVGKPYEVLDQHVNVLPDPPSRHEPNVDPQLERVILRAIEKTPASRYANASEMLNDLG